jgi:hypothetical protein
MKRFFLFALCAASLATAAALAVEMVEVPGSKVQFPAAIEATVAGKPVKMVLTGTAERRKFLVNVYALGSYVLEGAQVRSADELASLSASPKRLELVMERDVAGKDMAEAFETAIRANYPAPALNEEMKTLTELLQKEPLRKEDRVLLTYLPEVGLHCQVVNKSEFTIKNVQLARAVWDIYLGKNNLGEGIKKSLVSRVVPH